MNTYNNLYGSVQRKGRTMSKIPYRKGQRLNLENAWLRIEKTENPTDEDGWITCTVRARVWWFNDKVKERQTVSGKQIKI